MKEFIRIWFLAFFACCIVTAVAFTSLDVPVAKFVYPFVDHVAFLGNGMGSAVLLSVELATLMVLVYLRIVRGKLSRLSSVIALACLASICAYGINASVLKTLFGAPTPIQVLCGMPHTPNFFHGTPSDSFPSGHMALAGAFGGAFMWLYPKYRWYLAVLLALGASLLVIGDWHFVSDVVAGTFAGLTAGAVAAKLWLVHNSRDETRT